MLSTDMMRYVENERGNSARNRNARLAAIHSFFVFWNTGWYRA